MSTHQCGLCLALKPDLRPGADPDRYDVLLGTILFVRAVLPHLRGQGGGRVIQVSSEGGRIVYPSFSTYHASKWGQKGFIEAVAKEIEPFGIEMFLVEPRTTSTSFLSGAEMSDPLPDYAGSPVAGLRAALMGGGFDVTYGDPVLIAQAIIAFAETPQMPLRVPMGSVAWENIDRKENARLALLSTQKNAADACYQATNRHGFSVGCQPSI